MRTYTGLTIPLSDVDDWTLASALRGQAAERPDAVYLDAPDEGRTWTYAETLAVAESIATNFHAAGLGYGDRVLMQMFNSSSLVFTWFGAMVGGLVEVPINTAYEFDFLAHQVRTRGRRSSTTSWPSGSSTWPRTAAASGSSGSWTPASRRRRWPRCATRAGRRRPSRSC
jgi:acyl-CoA synthetase (AMP-forming)/AMP-acid ligase II